MAKAKQTAYNDQSITKLKGKDRVRLRPAVIFGSDGLEGCQHSFFEILANAVDEARAGYGNEITVTAYRDLSIRVEDNGRGVPLGYNEKEGCYIAGQIAGMVQKEQSCKEIVEEMMGQAAKLLGRE